MKKKLLHQLKFVIADPCGSADLCQSLVLQNVFYKNELHILLPYDGYGISRFWVRANITMQLLSFTETHTQNSNPKANNLF